MLEVEHFQGGDVDEEWEEGLAVGSWGHACGRTVGREDLLFARGSVYVEGIPMRHVVILSPHRPSRELLSRLLSAPDLRVAAMGDADEALDAIAEQEPALVVVDARRPDEDQPLMLGLLKRRHPRQPLITLVPGRLRVFDGHEERVLDVGDGSAEALHAMLSELQRATRDLLAQHLLRVLRPPTGEA